MASEQSLNAHVTRPCEDWAAPPQNVTLAPFTHPGR
jgi:hypothetical protein